MESTAAIGRIMTDLMLSLPSLIATIVCLIIIVLRWKRHPKVSLMASVGLGLLLLHNIVFTVIYATVPRAFIRSSYTADDIQNVFLVLGLIFNVARVIAFTPLLAAIFIKRPAST